MNENCQKWHGQLNHLRKKHAEFLQTYADALEFAEQNPKIRETSFARCRALFYEIKPLVMELREDFPRLTKEQKAELALLKTNFDVLPQLHEGIKWEDVEKSLKKSPDAIDKLRAFDEKGHKMNVFREENGEYIFVSAWKNVELVSTDHRNICFDAEGQTLAKSRGKTPTGNAVDIIAKIMGVKDDVARNFLAESRYYDQLGEVVGNHLTGWAWLETDPDTRKDGSACVGRSYGISKASPCCCDADSSFRAALRVKKT